MNFLIYIYVFWIMVLVKMSWLNVFILCDFMSLIQPLAVSHKKLNPLIAGHIPSIASNVGLEFHVTCELPTLSKCLNLIGLGIFKTFFMNIHYLKHSLSIRSFSWFRILIIILNKNEFFYNVFIGDRHI